MPLIATSFEHILLPPLRVRPAVSILIPSYNQGRFIRETIDSILNQDYRPLKIHVIDGGSTDETVDVLKSYGDIPELQWISEPDNGVVDAVNKGFARVTGEIVGIQSSDDMYLPGAISRIVEVMREDPSLGLVYGDTVKVDAEGRELLKQVIGPWSLENVFLLKTWIPQPSAFFRREMLDACGGWDERIPYSPDTDLWLRMSFKTQVRKIDQFLSQRRIHDAQRDTQAAKIVRDYCQMIDQLNELTDCDERVRNASKAAKHLIRIRYNASGSDWLNAWNHCCASFHRPDLFQSTTILRHLLLPTRRFMSRIKCALRDVAKA